MLTRAILLAGAVGCGLYWALDSFGRVAGAW